MAEQIASKSKVELAKRVLLILASTIGITVVIYYVFGYTFAGILLNTTIRFLIIALFLPFVFILYPLKKQALRWFDLLIFLVAFAVPLYFVLRSRGFAFLSWGFSIPLNTVLGFILCLLILEGARRMGGLFYLGVCLIIGVYPLFAGVMPGVLHGRSLSLISLIGAYASGPDTGFPGLPTQIMVEILIGFLVYSAVLTASGAGDFFLKLAFGLLGRFRGGPAKVSVLASGLFGSMSGSEISNVIGTGSFTIPAMKKMGYPPVYAGAIEACASTGGVLMPPVMGAVAFVMADFIGVSYNQIIICATIPAILYYWGLLLQVDAYSAKVGLVGLPRKEIPPLGQTLKEGWHFILAFAFLFFCLLYLRVEIFAPFYSAGLLFFLSMFRKKTRMGPRRILGAIEEAGKLISITLISLLPISFVICGLTVTGAAPAFTSGFVRLSGNNAYVAILLGVVACYIIGMVGSVIPAYVFLAVSLAPMLVNLGFDVMGVHLFILYYAMLAGITAPVAPTAFVAASLAKAPPMATALRAMRLGIVIYFLPFLFLFNPALLITQGGQGLLYTFWLFILCLIGILPIAAGVEGYLIGIGRLPFWSRIFLVISGLAIGFPGNGIAIVGFTIAIATVAILHSRKRKAALQRV